MSGSETQSQNTGSIQMPEMWQDLECITAPSPPQKRNEFTPYARPDNAMPKMPPIRNKPAISFLMESRMHGNMHVRFGERGRRNHSKELLKGAPAPTLRSPEPSQEDHVLTQQIYQSGKLHGIKMLDHVIIGDGTDRYMSFADDGLLQYEEPSFVTSPK